MRRVDRPAPRRLLNLPNRSKTSLLGSHPLTFFESLPRPRCESD